MLRNSLHEYVFGCDPQYNDIIMLVNLYTGLETNSSLIFTLCMYEDYRGRGGGGIV